MFPPRAPAWTTDGRDWPNRDMSRFVRAGGIEWHVQVAGDGPVCLLLHGAGGASHSWGGLLPLLSDGRTVVAPDLPGHGFTAAAPGAGPSMAGMARQVGDLLVELGHVPTLTVGHSAGAALAARMVLDGRITPEALVAINGAFAPFGGLPGVIFPAMARMLHWNPFAARMIATAALDPNAIPGLLRGMGSRLPAETVDVYARLFRRPAHVAGTIAMMADWDLDGLIRELPTLETPMLLLAAQRDRAVPLREATRIGALLSRAECEELPGLGHLAHEEAPNRIAEAIEAFAGRHSL